MAITLSANATEAKAAFGDVGKALGNLKEKAESSNAATFNANSIGRFESGIARATGSLASLGIAFHELQSGTANTSTVFQLLHGTVQALSTGMRIATSVATGLKAGLLGSGIGILVLGLGYLVSKLDGLGGKSHDTAEDMDALAR